jgi:hypothetical protein
MLAIAIGLGLLALAVCERTDRHSAALAPETSSGDAVFLGDRSCFECHKKFFASPALRYVEGYGISRYHQKCSAITRS